MARVATNACHDYVPAKSPARTRLKYSLRELLSRRSEFALWKYEDGFLITASLLDVKDHPTESLDDEAKEYLEARVADAGVDLVKIKELMGHQCIETTMRYLHTTDKGKRGAITQLSEYRQMKVGSSLSQISLTGRKTAVNS